MRCIMQRKCSARVSGLPSAGPVCPWREDAERTEHRRCNPDHGPYNVVSLANQKPRPIAARSILRSDGRLLPTKEVPDEHAAESEFHTTTGTKLSAPQTNPLRRCHQHDCGETFSSLGWVAVSLSPCTLPPVWLTSIPSLSNSPWIRRAPERVCDAHLANKLTNLSWGSW